VTDQVQKKNVRVEHCPTDEMVADFFTKTFTGNQVSLFSRSYLGMPLSGAIKECVQSMQKVQS
jgi:hypothetical protein